MTLSDIAASPEPGRQLDGSWSEGVLRLAVKEKAARRRPEK